MSYFYHAYGLSIRSDVDLPELLPAYEGKDVTIRLNGTLPRMQEGSAWQVLNREEAILQLENVGVYRVCGGREIAIAIAKGADESWARAVLLGVVMGVLLYQRNNLVLHASSIQIGRSAVAFLGNSGQGKSSIAAALLARGHHLLADEPTCLGMETEAPLVRPGYRQFKLDPKVASFLGFDPTLMHPLYNNEEKRGLRVPMDLMGTQVPLKSIYLLEKRDIGLQRVTPSIGLMEIVGHSHPKGAISDYFNFCGQIAKHIPIFRLGRGTGINSLWDLARTVEENCMGEVNDYASGCGEINRVRSNAS